ncbi:hypothetical protein G5B38_06870 [Pseudohalocynthiibacter aestuariivivens]|nr:hypothetical protein [Pseudohalocynthiibacter aestuariivivens]QIE45267.1 hypothetical protein G5B38_06870 [Pseudohalocynthiibacter aestuariivivens]
MAQIRLPHIFRLFARDPSVETMMNLAAFLPIRRIVERAITPTRPFAS